ncbi:hypothetical protein G6F57_023724 [Rhizopus arrhizus]|nr:hypothetical protein G6F57_023724 [Rhizopus arrhizus]
MHSPEADAAAVLEHRLGGEITAGEAARAALGQPGLGFRVAVRHGRLAACRIVAAQGPRQTRAAGPLGIWRICAIADEIAAQVGRIEVHDGQAT